MILDLSKEELQLIIESLEYNIQNIDHEWRNEYTELLNKLSLIK